MKKKSESKIICPHCRGSGKVFLFFICPICLGKKKGRKEDIEEAERLFEKFLIELNQQQKF